MRNYGLKGFRHIAGDARKLLKDEKSNLVSLREGFNSLRNENFYHWSAIFFIHLEGSIFLERQIGNLDLELDTEKQRRK